ncbi:MAG: hypothetical protein LRS46_01015 [Desulfurococcales archaeon]|nr:hypothetical protein [Desulfurococcales archaeon]
MVEPVKELDGVYILEGPMGLELLHGEAVLLGFPVARDERLVVPIGRRLPVHFRGAKVKVFGGQLRRGSLESYKRMQDAARRLSELSGRILLIGPPDSGKSTLAAWSVNASGGNFSLLSVDVGQNEYYAPGFETLVHAGKRPLIPGLAMESLTTCFVGSFTPSRALDRYIACASSLSRMNANILVDTDGWIAVPSGMASKAALAEAVKADYIVSIGLSESMAKGLAKAVGAELVNVSTESLVPGSSKSWEERRAHRDRLIAARLVGSNVIPIKAGETPLINSPVFNCDQVRVNLPGIIYAERCGDEVVLVVRGPRVNTNSIGRRTTILVDGWERNRLAAVVGEDSNHHIALINKINYKNKIIVLKTPYKGPPRAILIGEARVTVTLGD